MSSRRRLGRLLVATLAAFLASMNGCKVDESALNVAGSAGMADCLSSGGPVEDGATDTHCTDPSGQPIIQPIGKCETGAATLTNTAGAAGAGGNDGQYLILTGHQGQDDDCKYDVSFTNSCVVVNQPVTFKVTLTARDTRKPASGARPDSPEAYLMGDPSHISPSLEITAKESPTGTYSIGPIVFDRAGRWVVRFHFFETCSDVPADSPHGHIAFYIDVP